MEAELAKKWKPATVVPTRKRDVKGGIMDCVPINQLSVVRKA